MKRIIFLFTLFLLSVMVYADISNQINELYHSIEIENWEEANSQAKNLLDFNLPENETTAAIRYCYIYSSAGLVATDKITFSDLSKIMEEMKNKRIMTFGYMLYEKYRHNAFQAFINTEDSEIKVFVSNKKKINIFAFIDIPIDLNMAQKNVGNYCYFYGKIKSVEIHDSQSKLWLMRIILDDTQIIPKKLTFLAINGAELTEL